MKRRNFLHWVLSLPIVGSMVGKVSGHSNMEEFARGSGQICGDHLVAQKERRHTSLQQYANEVAKEFGSKFHDMNVTSAVAQWGKGPKVEMMIPWDKDHPLVIDEIEHKYVSYTYGGMPKDGDYWMDLRQKSNMVLAIDNLVNAVKEDMDNLGSKRIVFFTPFSPLPPDYGVVQAQAEFCNTSIGVTIDQASLGHRLCVTVSVAYGIDVS